MPTRRADRRHASFRLSRPGQFGPSHLGLAVSGVAYWRLLGWKISLLSSHAAVLAGVASIPIGLIAIGAAGGPQAGPMLGVMVVMSLVSIPLGWVFSFLANGVLCLVLLPCVYLAQRLIGGSYDPDTTGWIAGSSVALVGSVGGLAPFVVMAGGDSINAPSGVAGMMAYQAASSLLGIAAAQAGGYLGSLSGLRRRTHREPTGTPRYSMWGLLAVTAILAVIASLFSLADELAVPLIIALFASSVIAWAIHRPIAWLTNRWLDWRLAKRREKRAARLV